MCFTLDTMGLSNYIFELGKIIPACKPIANTVREFGNWFRELIPLAKAKGLRKQVVEETNALNSAQSSFYNGTYGLTLKGLEKSVKASEEKVNRAVTTSSKTIQSSNSMLGAGMNNLGKININTRI